MGWVTGHAVAIFSALLAAFWAAVGIVVRQRVAQSVPADKSMSATMAASMARDPLWWAGTLAAVGGYVFQAVALAHGSLLLVQPLIVSSLLFALPLSARLCHHHVRLAEWGWAMLLTAALAVFVLFGQPREGHNRPPVPAWTLALIITVPLVIACVVAAHRAVGRPRAMLLAVAVAVMLGMVAVLTKICTHRFAVGGWHALLTVPAPYVLVALAAALTVVQQAAFHAGALQASVPIMLVGEPIVAVLLGVVVLGEHLSVRGSAAAVLVVAVVAMVAATVALARDQASAVDDSALASSPECSTPTAAVPASSRT
ncbi:MAG: DMT family transporter [Mycobacterium sp.]|nr:DMT family transporter [Mycobacterium sp.]MBW0015704.1 DMT family transporter [Mycobacterium sp.]